MSPYTPLDSPETQIRLLQLEPGLPNEAIVCTLDVVNVPTTISYEALSYAWGADEASFEILLDGVVFCVRSNLNAALRRLRDQEATRVLWIDAISINQEDILERNAQVGIMRTIYRNAEQVLVWLGDAENDSDLVMTESGTTKNYHAMDVAMRAAVLKEPRWSAYAQFLQRPWWRRTWIVQELAVAKSVRVLCGSRSLDWDDFVTNNAEYVLIIAPIEELRDIHLHDVVGMQCSIELTTLRAEFTEDDRSHSLILRELLQRFRHCEASDPRDKVYGLLGLAEDNTDNRLKPDYALSVAEVYQEVSEHLLAHHLPFTAFGLIDNAMENIHNLPSWVADWSQDTFLSPFLDLYSASGDTSPDITFSGRAHELTVTVALLDEVLRTIPRHHHKRYWQSLEATVVEFMRGLEWPSYSDEAAVRAAYRRTLVADALATGTSSGRRLDEEMFIRFNQWFKSDYIGPVKQKPENFEGQPEKVMEISLEGPQRILPTSMSDLAQELDAWSDKKAGEDEREFGTAVSTALTGRVMFINANMFIDIASEVVKEGDLLCIPLGGRVPWIVRKADDVDGRYVFISECYVHGIMDGEVMDRLPEGSVKKITLV